MFPSSHILLPVCYALVYIASPLCCIVYLCLWPYVGPFDPSKLPRFRASACFRLFFTNLIVTVSFGEMDENNALACFFKGEGVLGLGGWIWRFERTDVRQKDKGGMIERRMRETRDRARCDGKGHPPSSSARTLRM